MLNELSQGQRAVLALVAQGLGNAAIGARLCVEASTVAARLTAIYRALGVRNRTEAARVYWQTEQGEAWRNTGRSSQTRLGVTKPACRGSATTAAAPLRRGGGVRSCLTRR